MSSNQTQTQNQRDDPSMIVFCVAFFIVGAYILCKKRFDSDEENETNTETENSFLEFHRNNSSPSVLQARLQTLSDVEIVGFIRNKILPVHEKAVRAVVFVPGQYSETLNKNIIRICVRDSRGRIFPVNTLVHVALHELAHTCMSEYDPDHSEKFFATFNPLLEKAILLKIFNPKEKLDVHYMDSCTRKR